MSSIQKTLTTILSLPPPPASSKGINQIVESNLLKPRERLLSDTFTTSTKTPLFLAPADPSKIKLQGEELREAISPTTKRLARINQKQEADVTEQLRGIFGDDVTLLTRPKGETSALDKVVTKVQKTGTPIIDGSPVLPNTMQARNMIGDAVGGRVILPTGTTKEVDMVVSQLTEAIKKGDIKLSELNNYKGKDGLSYFTDEHVLQIQEAHAIAQQKGLVDTPLVVISGSNSKAIKNSGYTTIQMNATTRNGAKIELQIRGPEIQKLGEIEHLIYDLRQGKSIPAHLPNEINRKMTTLSETLNSLPKEAYDDYMGYLTQAYKNARLKETGVTEIPKLILPKSLKHYKELELGALESLHDSLPKHKGSQNPYTPPQNETFYV
jgi:ppGpp synthetase/RelA/SpoT-type nucleotidyltranferase